MEDHKLNTAEMIKKTLAFTIGAAEFSKEKIKQFADDMVARGEMSSEDARSFVDDVTKRAEEQKQTIQDWMKEQSTKMVQQAGAADSARVEKLEQRIAALELKVAKLLNEPCGVEDEVCVVDPTTGTCAHGSPEGE